MDGRSTCGNEVLFEQGPWASDLTQGGPFVGCNIFVLDFRCHQV